MSGTSLFRGTLLLKHDLSSADVRTVRVVGIFTPGVLALTAAAAALVPLALRHHKASAPAVFEGSTSSTPGR